MSRFRFTTIRYNFTILRCHVSGLLQSATTSQHVTFQVYYNPLQLHNMSRFRFTTIRYNFSHVSGLLQSATTSQHVTFQVYYNPLQLHDIIEKVQILWLFPNLDELIKIHKEFCNKLLERRRHQNPVEEVTDIIIAHLSRLEKK